MLPLNDILLLLATGACTGFLAGLLGIGGGMLSVPFMIIVFNHQGFSQEIIVHMAVATGMATILITSMSAVRTHHQHGSIDWKLALTVSPGMVVGGLIGGSFLLELFNTAWLSLFFAFFILYSALQMYLDKKPKPGRELPNPYGIFGVGLLIGSVSSLLGAGGAFLMVPFLIWCNITPHVAMATSSALGLFTAAASVLGYIYGTWNKVGLPEWSLGYIYLPAAICIVSSSVFTAPQGAKMARRMNVRQLKKVFALMLLFFALFMFNEAYKALVVNH